jgi:hypothetical protein
MDTDRSSKPSLKAYWVPALLVLAGMVIALLWVIRAPAFEALRTELTVGLVSGGLATAVATTALYVRAHAAQALGSTAERFLMIREGQVHAGVAWIACFTVVTLAIVAVMLSRVDRPTSRPLRDARFPACPQLLEHRVIACCHDRVRGVCEPCATGAFCAEYCCDIPIADR